MEKHQASIEQINQAEDLIIKGIKLGKFRGEDFIITKGKILNHNFGIIYDIKNEVFLATDMDDIMMADIIVAKLQWYIATGWREVGMFKMNSELFMNHPYLSVETVMRALQ